MACTSPPLFLGWVKIFRKRSAWEVLKLEEIKGFGKNFKILIA